MNTKLMKTYGPILVGALLLSLGSGCSLNKDSNATTAAALQAASLLTNSNIPGTGSTFVPTQAAVMYRVQKSLAGSGTAVSPLSGNFKTAYTQVGTNLPQTTNPQLATGYGQALLLAYGACSDVQSGAYGVNFNNPASGQTNTLVQAGVTMLNTNTGGLASADPASAPSVAAAFQQLVTADEAVSGETTQQVFVSVCMAAATYGSVMTGM